MSPSHLHRRPDETTQAAEAEGAEQEGRATSLRVTVVVQTRHEFDTAQVTGAQIKETASVPAGFALYRRMQGGNELISDDALVELRNGDHFFARPPSNAPIEHGER